MPRLGKLGHYRIRCRLGSGGMGEVFLARMRAPKREERWVALKILRSELAEDPRFLSMFLDEARIASVVQHPNVCTVVDFGRIDGRYFLAFEYLYGETFWALVEAIRRADAPAFTAPVIDLLARLVADTARGLHAAHEARDAQGVPLGIVHRDVSAENVFVLYNGIAKIVDFGIALAANRESRTAIGEFKGKLASSAPEQLTGGRLDRRTDVFALGILLWEATLGRRLFRGDNEGETIRNVLDKPIDAPSRLIPGYPKALEKVAMRALERTPEKRHPTAAAFAEEIDCYLASTGAVGAGQVSEAMRLLFEKEIAMRESILRDSTAPVPVKWTRGDRASTTLAETPRPRIGGGLRSRRRGRRSPMVVLVTALVAALVGGLAVSFTVHRSEQGAQAGEAERHGHLTLVSQPANADVFLDGKRIGATPLRAHAIPAGSHEIALMRQGGGGLHRSRIRIRPDAETTIRIDLPD